MTAPTTLRIQAAPGAGLLCRLIGLVAQHDLDIVSMEVRPAHAGTSSIRLAVTGLDAHGMEIVVHKMTRIIGVETVVLDEANAGTAARRAA